MKTIRLWQVIKWNFISNRNKTMRSMLAICGVFLAFCIINTQMLWNYEPMTDSRISSLPPLFLVGFVACMIHNALSTCFNMKTQTEKLSVLMLPATKTEKFLANVFEKNIIGNLSVAIALIAADVIQMFLSWVFCGNAISIIFGDYTSTLVKGIWNITDTAGICFAIAFFFLCHSTLLLGSTFFTKRQFIFTILTVTFVPVILSTIITFIGVQAYDYFAENSYEVSIIWIASEKATEWIAVCTVALWALTNYCLSYFFFRRIQIINNKFFN